MGIIVLYNVGMYLFKGRLSRKNFVLGLLLSILTVAFIGILLSVVFTSLDGARQKNSDAQTELNVQSQHIKQLIEEPPKS